MKSKIIFVGFLLLALVNPLAGEEAKPENTAENLVTPAAVGKPFTETKRNTKPIIETEGNDLFSPATGNSLLYPSQPGEWGKPSRANKRSVLFNFLGLPMIISSNTYASFKSAFCTWDYAMEWDLLPKHDWTLLFALTFHYSQTSIRVYEGMSGYYYNRTIYRRALAMTGLDTRYYYRGNRIKGGGWLEGGFRCGYVEMVNVDLISKFGFLLDVGTGYRFVFMQALIIEPFAKFYYSFDHYGISTISLGVNIGFHKIMAKNPVSPKAAEPKRGSWAVLLNPLGFAGVLPGNNFYGILSSLSYISLDLEWQLGKSGKWSILLGTGFLHLNNSFIYYKVFFSGKLMGRYYYNGNFNKGGAWTGLGTEIGYDDYRYAGANLFRGLNCTVLLQSGYRFRLKNMFIEPFAGYDLSLMDLSLSQFSLGLNIGYYSGKN